MKAVKITNIIWNTTGLTEEEITKLPTAKGFTVKDDFNVMEKVPSIFEKKYGRKIMTFNYTECRIAETIDELLEICLPKDKKGKNLWTPAGKLSANGLAAKEELERNVNARIQLERKGVSNYEMPKILDEVMISLEKITGLDWEVSTPDEMLAPIYRKIWDKRAVNIKMEKEMKEAAEAAMEAEEDEDED